MLTEHIEEALKRAQTILSALLITVVVVLWQCSGVNASTITLISQGDTWDYAVLPSELWGGGIACWTCPGTWDFVGYDYVDWNSLSYASAHAAFGNPYELPYQTYWQADTDLALHTVTLGLRSDRYSSMEKKTGMIRSTIVTSSLKWSGCVPITTAIHSRLTKSFRPCSSNLRFTALT